MGYSSVALPIPSRDDRPSVRQPVFTNPAVKHQLVTAGLDHWRGRVQFVEEKDSFAVTRKKIRRCPPRFFISGRTLHCRVLVACFQIRQPAKIDRIEQQGAYVLER